VLVLEAEPGSLAFDVFFSLISCKPWRKSGKAVKEGSEYTVCRGPQAHALPELVALLLDAGVGVAFSCTVCSPCRISPYSTDGQFRTGRLLHYNLTITGRAAEPPEGTAPALACLRAGIIDIWPGGGGGGGGAGIGAD
jgi:hypothetical protein